MQVRKVETFTVKAPTRADLAGGTLDLWPIYCLLGNGKTVNVALDLFAKVHFEIQSSNTFKMTLATSDSTYSFSRPLSFDESKKLSPALQFPAAVVSQYVAQKESLPKKHIHIILETEAPAGSGLGGSSALCVALVRGLSKIFGDFVEEGWQWRLLEWVKDVEAGFLGLPTGTQDYLAALFGGANCFVSEIGGIRQMGYSKNVSNAISEHLLVLFSGEAHHSGLSNWELYKKVMAGDTEILRGFTTIKEIADALDKELRSATLNWHHIGDYLNEEWRVRKGIFQVHTKRLDDIVEFLLSQKVLGCKVCGAAQGGSLVALVDPAARTELTRLISRQGTSALPASVTASPVLSIG